MWFVQLGFKVNQFVANLKQV